MVAFPIDRTHPPRRIQYHDDSRHLEIAPWAFEEIDACIAAIDASLPELRAFLPWAHEPLTREGQYRVFASFLVRIMTLLAIDRFGCDRVQVLHDEANDRSRRVIERCGFTLEGTVRNVASEPGERARGQGYRGTRRERLYAILPEDLVRLPWVHAVRVHTTLVDAMGGEQAWLPPEPSIVV
jgi:hypothetical protein